VKLRDLLRPIRVRLTLWYVLLLGIVLALFGGTLYGALQVSLYDDLDDVLINSTSLVINSLQIDARGHLSTGSGSPLTWSDPERGEHFWRVLDRAGQIVAQAGVQDLGDSPADPAVFVQALAGRDVFQTVYVRDEAIRVYTAPVAHGGQIVAVVQQGIPMEEAHKILAAFRWILLLALPLTLALASGGGLFLAGRALRPVDLITRAAQTIGARDLSQRLNLNLPDDELGRLARTFDAMIARLDGAFRRQRRFTADASHELRTPLTIIKGDLSLALARPRDAEYYRQVLVEVDDEVDQMGRLVERLLALARADAEGVSLQRQPTDLSALLADLVEQTRPLAEAKGLDLVTQIAPDLMATVDPDAVIQVVLNLLENAIKYTPSGRVRLSVYRIAADDEVRIAVADGGPGIPAEHLPHIFDRFYRVDGARSRELGGTGLGLAIARDLTQAHGGEIAVHSVAGEGSTFTVHLPVG
jgi:heavy metal sensor kinase